MQDCTIKRKHLKWLALQIDEELKKDAPDVSRVLKLQNDLSICKQKKLVREPGKYNNDPFWMEIALKGLERAPMDKSLIRGKIQAKMDELKRGA